MQLLIRSSLGGRAVPKSSAATHKIGHALSEHLGTPGGGAAGGRRPPRACMRSLLQHWDPLLVLVVEKGLPAQQLRLVCGCEEGDGIRGGEASRLSLWRSVLALARPGGPSPSLCILHVQRGGAGTGPQLCGSNSGFLPSLAPFNFFYERKFTIEFCMNWKNILSKAMVSAWWDFVLI